MPPPLFQVFLQLGAQEITKWITWRWAKSHKSHESLTFTVPDIQHVPSQYPRQLPTAVRMGSGVPWLEQIPRPRSDVPMCWGNASNLSNMITVGISGTTIISPTVVRFLPLRMCFQSYFIFFEPKRTGFKSCRLQDNTSVHSAAVVELLHFSHVCFQYVPNRTLECSHLGRSLHSSCKDESWLNLGICISLFLFAENVSTLWFLWFVIWNELFFLLLFYL